MYDVEAHVARPAPPHDGVQVGAVVVHEAPGVVDYLAYLGYLVLEDPYRVRVGQHESSRLGSSRGCQGVEVHRPRVVTLYLHRLEARHVCAGWVRAVGAVRDDYLRPLLQLAVVPVVLSNEHYAGPLSVGPRRRLECGVIHPGDLEEVFLEGVEELEHPLHRLVFLHGVKPGYLRVGRQDLVDYGVILHGAAPERVYEAGVDAVVHLAEMHVVPQDLYLGEFGKVGGFSALEGLRDEVLGVQ